MNKGWCKMSDFRKYLDKQLKNEEFGTEHKAARAELEVVHVLIADRIESNLILSKRNWQICPV